MNPERLIAGCKAGDGVAPAPKQHAASRDGWSKPGDHVLESFDLFDLKASSPASQK